MDTPKNMPIGIKRVRSVRVVNGVRTERELQGKELEDWIKSHFSVKEKKNDNTEL